MKITELKVRGYRSLRDVVWRPGDLNVLIGPNGDGKSNLLGVLQLLNAAANGRLSKWVQQEGGMLPMVWDGQAERIDLEMNTLQIDGESGVPQGLRRSYHLGLGRVGVSGAYRVEDEHLGTPFRTKEEKPATGQVFLLHRSGTSATILDAAGARPRVPERNILDHEALLSTVAAAFSAHPAVRNFQRNVAGWGIHPEFHVGRDSAPRHGTVARRETRLDTAGENLISVLHTLYTGNRDFKRDLDQAMRAAFGDDFDEMVFPPEADQRIQLRVRWKSMSREQSAADLSDGTIRFLYLLAILANPDPPPLIAIDEPETGLHPTMQHIIAEFAAGAASRTQVVLTTHSPEFLDCFKDTIPTTTVVEWQEGQGTTLRSLSAEALAQWVKRFSLGEILRTGEAAIIESEEEG